MLSSHALLLKDVSVEGASVKDVSIANAFVASDFITSKKRKDVTVLGIYTATNELSALGLDLTAWKGRDRCKMLQGRGSGGFLLRSPKLREVSYLVSDISHGCAYELDLWSHNAGGC